MLTAGTIYETWALKADNHGTFSEFTRWAFRTDTAVGRAAFIAAVSIVPAWYRQHILAMSR